MVRILLWDVIAPRIGLRSLSERTRSARMRRVAASFRTLAVAMGGVLIKVGQFLSARLDVLPREITGELSGLQDEVGAESAESIRGVLEAELGAPLEERFAEFEPSPIASASIGQVHRARLPASAPEAARYASIVVKVQRPNIEEIVKIDLSALATVGGWLHRFKVVRRHVNVPALVEELRRSLSEETDYLKEGKNAEHFQAGFAGRPEIRVPGVVWSYTTRRVLTLEEVSAIKITDYASIEAAGIDRSEVAVRLVDSYLKQLFEDGFFHADPHPGNLFVHPLRGEKRGAFRLTFVDFGMVGTLSSEAFAGLREALIAVGTRDAERLVRGFQRLDVLLPSADLELLTRAVRRVFDRFWGKSTREVMSMGSEDFGDFTEEFGALLYEMPFQVPENLILLGRCVAILSGMASGLDPDFNVWRSIAPYAEKLIAAESGSGFEAIMKELGNVARTLARLPQRLETFVARAEEGRLDVRIPELGGHVHRIERAARKLGASIVFATLLLSSTLLFLGGHYDLATGGAVVSGLLGLWLIFGR